MSFSYYYDTLINDPKYTYRLVGQQSDEKDKKLHVIVRDLIREPLSISVAHSYSGKDFGVSAFLANMVGKYQNLITAYESGVSEQVQQLRSIIEKDYSAWNDLRTKNLNWIDYAREFQGTEVSIPLTLNARLYTRKFDKAYKTSTEQVQWIIKYFMGKTKDDSDTGIRYTAPHNFQVNVSGANVTQASRGTLGLLYGPTAVISNLLLTNFSVTMSKELTSVSGKIAPLYASVDMTFAPAFAFTIRDLEAIFKTDSSLAVFNQKGFTNTFNSGLLGIDYVTSGKDFEPEFTE